jgi:hypothetical protein
MTVTIGRRELLAALGGAAAASPLTVRAQQPGEAADHRVPNGRPPRRSNRYAKLGIAS